MHLNCKLEISTLEFSAGTQMPPFRKKKKRKREKQRERISLRISLLFTSFFSR